METGNLYHGIPASLSSELVQVLAQGEGVTIERIVSRGQCSPPGYWYDQSQSEWVALLSGEAILRFQDGEDLHLRPGMHVTIAAHRKHRVEWTSDQMETVWLAVFYSAGHDGAGIL